MGVASGVTIGKKNTPTPWGRDRKRVVSGAPVPEIWVVWGILGVWGIWKKGGINCRIVRINIYQRL